MPSATNNNSKAGVPLRHEGDYYIDGADMVVCVHDISHRVSCRRLRQ
jgi:hypothetical protein